MPTSLSAQAAPLLEMRNVSVPSMRDQSVVVAEEINWQVAPGDYWVIAGLQGSGKSDFLLMTGGLIAPAEGSYLLFGEAMPIFEDARLSERLRLGLAFESGQLFNHLTVSQNVALPLRYHKNLREGEADERTSALLEALELEPWADSTPGALGRNWQRRVGLARALALEPEALLLDSPLAGLDLRHANWWLRFLGQLSKGHPLLGDKPLTLVVTAADLRPWKLAARQFAVLRDKHFTVLGTWSQVEAASSELLHELLLEPLGA